MAQKKKLFLLDGFALIFRAHFAFINNPRINSKGLNTSAVFGFTNTILEIIKNQKPTHIAVAFDTAEPTHRHTEFEAYKAHRDEMPEDIAKSIPYIFNLLKAMNICTFSKGGFEADDIIGTLAVIAEKNGFETYMMTPDKDFGQLVSENIHIYKPARMGNAAEVLGVREICAKYEIQHPKQVIDILGLMGDTADNIPGIPGVGEKTAIQLIKQFGSVENLLENTHELKGKLKEKVENNKEMAVQSKWLATILCDVLVDWNEDELKLKEVNKEAIKELFAELEFKTLLPRLIGTPAPAASLFSELDEKENSEVEKENFKTAATTSHEYILLDSNEKIELLVNEILQKKVFCFDTETTALEILDANLVGMSFSMEAHKAYYLPFPEEFEAAKSIVEKFKYVFLDESIVKIAQNIKFDLSVLKKYGIEIRGKHFDTMLAHYILEPDSRHGMDFLSETILGYQPIEIETLIGAKGKNQKSMKDVPIDLIKEYAAEDADVTYQLYQIISKKIEEIPNAKSILEDVEIPLVPVLSAMEEQGVRIDEIALKEMSKDLEIEIAKLEEIIIELAGTKFNIASPKQLGDVLFDVLKIDEKAKKTKTGQYATGEDVLSKLENKHPIITKILDYRELQKLKNTYVDTLPLLVNKKSNRIHTSFNQAVAATGRLSSNNPNLQNIPIKTAKGREVRKAFIARSQDYLLLSADYSQIELRIIASMSGDKGMIDAFNAGLDIHTATASKVFGVELSEVTKEMRGKAKMVNFGIIYGISAFGLSERLNIPRHEAKEIIDNYFKEFGMLRQYMQNNIEFAKQHGFVETLIGRRRYLRDINSANAMTRGFAERNAINAPIQGTAADMIKIAMIKIHKRIQQEKLDSRMILQVHDELVFDVHPSELEKLKEIVSTEMRNALLLKVPVEVEMGTGRNWLEAH
jgi:DNA polymerase-1